MSYQIDVNINASELDNITTQMDNAANSVVKAAISLGEVDIYEGFELQNIQEDLKKDVNIDKLVAAIDKISQISNNQKIQGKTGIDLAKPLDNIKNSISGNIKQEPFLKSPEEVLKYQKNLESLVKNDAKLRIPKEGQSDITTSLNSIISGIFKSAKTIGNAGSKSEFGGQELAQIPNILNKLSENSTKGSFGDIVQLLRDSINGLNSISNVLSIKGVQRIKNSVEEPVDSLNSLGKLIELPPNRIDSRSTIGNLKSNIDKNGGSEEADILAKRLRSNSSEKVKQEILLGLTEIFSTISSKIKEEVVNVVNENQDFQLNYAPRVPKKPKKEIIDEEPSTETKRPFGFNKPKNIVNSVSVKKEDLDEFVKSIEAEQNKITLANFRPKEIPTNSTEQLVRNNLNFIPNKLKEIEVLGTTEKQFRPTTPNNSNLNSLKLEGIGNGILEEFITSVEKKALTLSNKDFDRLFKPVDYSNELQEFFTEYKKLEKVLDYPVLSISEFNKQLQPKTNKKKLKEFFTPYSPVVPQSQKEITIDGVVNNQKLPPTPYVSRFKWKKPELEKIGNSILSDFVIFIEKEALELKDTDYNKVFKLPPNKSEEFFKPYKKEKVRDPKTELSSETFYQQFPVKKEIEDKFKLDKIAKAYKDKLEQAETKNLVTQSSTAFKIYNSLDNDRYKSPEPKKDEKFNQLINDISIGELPLAKLKTVVTELISLLEDRLAEVSYPLPLQNAIIDGGSAEAAKIEPEKPKSKSSFNPNKIKPEDNKIIQSTLEFINKVKQDSLKLDYSSFTKAQQPKPIIDNNEFFKSYKQPTKNNNPLTQEIFNSQIQPLQQWKLEFPRWWEESPVWSTSLPDWWTLDPKWSSDLPVWWNQEILPNSRRQKLLDEISGNQKILNSTEELEVQKPYNSSNDKNQDNKLSEILDAEIIEEVELLKEGNRYLSARNQKLLSTAKDIENPGETPTTLNENVSTKQNSIKEQLSLAGSIGSDLWDLPSSLLENDPWLEKQKQIQGQKILPPDPNYVESPWIEQEKIEVESTLLRLKPQIESLSDFLTNIDQKLELIKRETILKLPQSYINKEIQNPWGNDKYNQINDPWDSKLETQTTKPQFLLSPDPGYQEDPWIEKEIKKTQYKLLQLKPAISSLSDSLTNVDQQIVSTLRIKIPQIAPLSGSSVRAKFAEDNAVENPWNLPDSSNQLGALQSVPRNPPQDPRGNNPNVGQQKPQLLLNPAFGSIADPWFSLITLTKNKLVEQQKIPSGNQPLLQLKPAFEPTIIGETFNTLGSSFDEFISHIDSQLKEKGNVDFPDTIGDFETFLKQIDQDLENISSSEFRNFLNNIDLDLDRMQKSGADKFLARIDQELSKFPQRKNIKEESTDIQGSTKEFLLNSAEKIWPFAPDKPTSQKSLDQPVFNIPEFVKLFSSQIPQKPDLTEFFKPYNNNSSSSSEEITIDVAVISKVTKTIAEAEAGLKALAAAAKILGGTGEKEKSNKITRKEKDEKSSDAQLIRELIQEITLLIAKKDFVGAKELAGKGNLEELSGSKAEYQQIRIDKAEQKDIFDQAKQRTDVLKNLVTSGVSTAKNIGQVNSKDIFGENLDKISEENYKKAKLLIDKVNQWLEKETERFNNEIINTNLSLSKKEAELGNQLPLKNIPLNEGSYRDVQIAQNKEGETQLKSQRKKLAAELAVAISTLGSEQKELIAGVLGKIREQKTKVNSPDQLGSQKTKDLETLELKKLENKANNRIEGFKDSGGSTNALRDLQAAQASISQFVRELKDLVAGFIEVSSAVNKEVIKLSVANNGNLAQTEQDIKLATDSAKKFGGSVSGYLKDLAGIKIADQRTIDRSGSLSNNRYTDGDVKSLLSGLRSAYAVNQLNGEQQDGASIAVLQILSKGKVQAEELRGQLGDRLNGAVNLFAQALGISTAQLDRRLKEGSILDLEVFKFGRLLEQNYAKAAEKPTLIKETTALQGNAKDFATLATQPLAGIATVSAQFVNQMADGFKSNASLFTVASIPIGLLLAQGISGGVANAFTKSSFIAPIISALGTSFKSNLGTLGIVGGGLGVAVAASSILGTSGLDQTISKLGDKIKDLVDWAAGLTKNGLTETNKIGKNIGVDAAFGILPLAAVISPITSYIANGLAPTFDRFKEGFSANNKSGTVAPQKTSLLTNIGNGIASIDRAALGNTALAITTAVAAYAIANTTFISKYQKISEQLALDFKPNPTKNQSVSILEKINKLKENEGTKDFNLDTVSTAAKDYGTEYNTRDFTGQINNEDFNKYVKDFSSAKLEEILVSEKYTNEQKRIVEELINLRFDKGYTPGQSTIKSYAGKAAEDFLNSSKDSVGSSFKNLNNLFDLNKYKEDFEKSQPVVDEFRNESAKLYKLQTEGGSQQEIDVQESVVKKLQTEARKATENITNSQLAISSIIKGLEAQKTNLENSKLGGAKEQAEIIGTQLDIMRKRLPELNKALESFSNPDQYVSDRKQEITRKKNALDLSEIKTKGEVSQEKIKFVKLREGDGNDFSEPVRQASLQTRESRANQNVAEQKYSLAKETRELLSKATYSEDNRIAYVEALKAETEALASVKEATYNTINARQSEKKAIEEFMQVTYDQKVRNFGSFTDSVDYGVGKSAKSGNLEDAILYGKLQKTEYELEKFKEILPKLTLNADAAKEKLRQLSDNVVLARLAYLEQSRTLIAERTFAERESVIDFSPFFENQRDIQAKSQVNIERKKDELTTNREQQKETRDGLLKIQDPTERANLAIKLTQLETDEIKKKYDLELSYLDLAKKKLDTAISQLNSGIGFSAGNASRESENQQYVRGRELEKRLSQAAAPNGGTLTPLGENQERIGLAKTNLDTLRSENEKAYQSISDSFLQIEGTTRESANAFVNLFKGKTSNQLKTDLALFEQQVTTAKADPNRESNQIDTVFGKGMDLNYAPVLKEAASQIQQLKEKEQGLSAALGDLENQRSKITNDVIRNTVDLKNSNNTANQELNKRNSDLSGRRVDFEKGTAQTIQDKLDNKTGKGKSFSGFLDVENIRFVNAMTSAKKQLEIVSNEVNANLRVLQDRETAGASPEELKNLQEKIKAQKIRVDNARLQVAETEQNGIESFLNNLISFDSGLENLFEGASTKLKEAVELLNQTITQVGELGLGTQFNLNKIVQTRQVAYKDKGQLKTREVLEEFNYDPNKTGSQEEAKIRASVSKRNAEIEAKKQALEFLKTNSQYLSDGSGIENTEQFKAANENTQKLMIEAQSLVGQLGISTTDYKQNIEDITKVLNEAITDPAKLQVMLNRNQLIQDRKENIQTLELQSTVEQNRERRLNSTRGMTDVQRILLGKEPLREDIKAQRQKAKLEYDISQEDGNSDIQKARGSLIYKDKTEDLDQQMKNLPQYAERFLFRIEEAVASSANIGGVLEKAIEEGNWSNVLKDILSNVIKSLASSFGQDASKGGGNLLSQGLGYLGGLASQGFNAIFGGGGGSSEAGSLPSRSEGYNLPNYAKGYNMGSDYPKTTNPDYREPGGNSHLAVIGRDEMVIPPDKIQAVLSHERGVMASTSVSNVNTVNNSPTSNNTTNNYSFASAGRKDSFGRPVINDQIDEQRRRKRHE